MHCRPFAQMELCVGPLMLSHQVSVLARDRGLATRRDCGYQRLHFRLLVSAPALAKLGSAFSKNFALTYK